MNPVFLTIVSSNYLAYAKTLFDSLEIHYPASKRVLCIVDAPDVAVAELGTRCTVLRLQDLGLPNHAHFVYRYGVMELNTAVKPYALAWIAKNMREAADGMMYIDPDIRFYRPLSDVEALIADGALAVLTPHLTAPLYDDKMPSELSIMRAGVYNCGFIAIGPHAQRGDFLEWWCRRLEYGAFVDFEAGLFTDQKWIDLAPGLFPDVRVLRHSGYNVAYWNLAHRPLAINADGRYTAGGSELAFFHFSGIDPHDASLLSKHQTRFTASDLGPFQPEYQRYLQDLLDNGYDRLSKVPYAYGVTRTGDPIVPEMRQVFRHRYDANTPHPAPDPFALGPESFSAPTDRLPKTPPRIPVLLFEAWKRRDLLKESFDVHSEEGREALLAWYTSVGERVVGVGSGYVAGARQELEHYVRNRKGRSSSPASGSSIPLVRGAQRALSVGGLRAFDAMRKSPRLRRVYYRIPAEPRGKLHRSLLRTIGKFSLWSAPDIGSDTGAEVTDPGINLVGYFQGEFSIGECARSFANATMRNGPPVALINFQGGVADRCGDHRFDKYLSPRPRFPVNVCFVNADQTALLFDTLPAVAERRYNIGFWFWELEKFPAAWQGALDLVDEVWVSSAFVQRAVSSAAGGKPVKLIPYPIEVSLSRPYSREEFDLAEEPFTFLFNFDYYSFVERKNPAALVKAFKQAFPDERDVSLVLKTTGAERAPDAVTALRQLAESDPRIVFLDRNLEREAMWGLLSVADAYVSLHRSEGFGLGLAESMILGKPVIGTGYSGNTDFMNAENSLLVDYRLVDVPDGAYPHSAGQQWADPDIDNAAECMRRIRNDAELRKTIAERGQAFVRAHLNERTASEAIAAELVRIAQLQRQP
jgi:glycosyltransferase involved in cell wall biosynthesis